MEDVYNQLNRYLRGSSRFGTNEGIARFLLTHLNEIPNMRLADVAERCYVSTPSVIRFCRELGYSDFMAFKEAARDYVRDIRIERIDASVPVSLLGSDEEFAASVEQWLDRLHDNTLRTLERVDRLQIEQLAYEIIDCRYVYIFGIGLAGLVGDHLRIHLARCGKPAVMLSEPKLDVELTPDASRTIGIVFTQHGRFLQNPKILPYLRRSCGRLWVITQEEAERWSPEGVDEFIRLICDEDNLETAYITMGCFAALLGEYCRELVGDRSGAEGSGAQ